MCHACTCKTSDATNGKKDALDAERNRASSNMRSIRVRWSVHSMLGIACLVTLCSIGYKLHDIIVPENPRNPNQHGRQGFRDRHRAGYNMAAAVEKDHHTADGNFGSTLGSLPREEEKFGQGSSSSNNNSTNSRTQDTAAREHGTSDSLRAIAQDPAGKEIQAEEGAYWAGGGAGKQHQQQLLQLDQRQQPTAEMLNGCIAAMERVESTMFATLEWNLTARAALEAAPDCPGLQDFARCGGEALWAAHRSSPPPSGRTRHDDQGGSDDDIATMEVRINDAVALNVSGISNPLLAWLGDVSQRKGKCEWRFGLAGDSTVRDFAGSWIELFVGPQDALRANAKKCFTMAVRVRTRRAALHIQ